MALQSILRWLQWQNNPGSSTYYFFCHFAIMIFLFSQFGLLSLCTEGMEHKFRISNYHLNRSLWAHRLSHVLTLHTVFSNHVQVFHLDINKYLKQNYEDCIMITAVSYVKCITHVPKRSPWRAIVMNKTKQNEYFKQFSCPVDHFGTFQLPTPGWISCCLLCSQVCSEFTVPEELCYHNTAIMSSSK